MPPIITIGKEIASEKLAAELTATNWKANRDGVVSSVIDINTDTGTVRPVIQPKSAPDCIGYQNNKALQAEKVFKMRARLQKKLKNKI
jgi:hypothetical protein